MPRWLADARLWVTLFIVAFWPAVWFGKYVGLAIALVVCVGGQLWAHAVLRRRDAAAATDAPATAGP
jgi:hypothetical protein